MINLIAPENFKSALIRGLSAAAGKLVTDQHVEAQLSVFTAGFDPEGGLDSFAQTADGFNAWCRAIYALEMRRPEAAVAIIKMQDLTYPIVDVVLALAMMDAGDAEGEARLVANLRRDPSLFETVINLRGVDIDKPIVAANPMPFTGHKIIPKPVFKNIGEIVVWKGPGPRSVNDQNPYHYILGRMSRADLKGRAYRTAMAAKVDIPSDFVPYLDIPLNEAVEEEHVTCLIGGAKRKLIDGYLMAKWGVLHPAYEEFFGFEKGKGVRSKQYQRYFKTGQMWPLD